ncbi:MAG: hypothetical protein IJK32_09870 [Bacteroidales bacterium]|nr:hypothetical protein [Bacteroidales bacterium]
MAKVTQVGPGRKTTGTIDGITYVTRNGVTYARSAPTMPASDEESMDVTIETIDTSGNMMNTKTISGVPFKRNRTTVLTGSLFSPSGEASFQVETAFDGEYHMEF